MYVRLAGFVFACGVCAAQPKFPLRPGEWDAVVRSDGAAPSTRRVCFNNETWAKALNPNARCKLDDLSVSAKGISYTMDCAGKSPTKATVELTFDGNEHMTGKASTRATVSGLTVNMQTAVDYRWKSDTCDSPGKPKGGN